MDHERENLAYPQLIEALRRLCREGRTGTMFVCTEENQALRFVLEKGRVVGCAYRRKHGREAIPLIQDVKAGRFSFSEGMFMVEEVPMPDTPVLFQLLEKHRPAEEEIELDALQRTPPVKTPPPAQRVVERVAHEEPAKPAEPAAPPPQPAPVKAEVRSAPAAVARPGINVPSAEELQGLVESRLALLMGPIGPLIAAQYAESMEGIETEEQLLAFIDQVRMEIPDEQESLAFRRALLDDLR